ncbi:hypothetical protein BDW02DRAFT_581616 [Decorospora gaudefroyi]|uniref:Uncharacterized protein n=1 Tax=Decorospora gaudefroyi TaxID=184978 RepID=A0A6A5K2X4_9PLEO|nr:hypothetical protein BDW02DRAFT_581616 [Decorospora gaudefroyi]
MATVTKTATTTTTILETVRSTAYQASTISLSASGSAGASLHSLVPPALLKNATTAYTAATQHSFGTETYTSAALGFALGAILATGTCAAVARCIRKKAPPRGLNKTRWLGLLNRVHVWLRQQLSTDSELSQALAEARKVIEKRDQQLGRARREVETLGDTVTERNEQLAQCNRTLNSHCYPVSLDNALSEAHSLRQQLGTAQGRVALLEKLAKDDKIVNDGLQTELQSQVDELEVELVKESTRRKALEKTVKQLAARVIDNNGGKDTKDVSKTPSTPFANGVLHPTHRHPSSIPLTNPPSHPSIPPHTPHNPGHERVGLGICKRGTAPPAQSEGNQLRAVEGGCGCYLQPRRSIGGGRYAGSDAQADPAGGHHQRRRRRSGNAAAGEKDAVLRGLSGRCGEGSWGVWGWEEDLGGGKVLCWVVVCWGRDFVWDV